MKRSNSNDFLMTAIIMAEAHGNCCSDNALYKNGLLLFIILYYNFQLLMLIVNLSLCFCNFQNAYMSKWSSPEALNYNIHNEKSNV